MKNELFVIVTSWKRMRLLINEYQIFKPENLRMNKYQYIFTFLGASPSPVHIVLEYTKNIY